MIAPAILWLSKHSGGAFKAVAKAVQIISTVATPIISALATAIQAVIDAMKWVIAHLPDIPSPSDILGGGAQPVHHPRAAGDTQGHGNVYLDGKLVGKWMRDSQRSYGRANSGKLIISPT